MKLLTILAAVLLFCAPPALAAPSELVIGSGIYGATAAPAGYQGPGNIVSGATAFYSCARAYNAAYANGTNVLCNVRNTVTAEKCDILVQTSGLFGAMANCTATSNGLSLAVFCALSAGNCAVVTMYDQTGNSHNITQATSTNQPSLTVSCVNSLPCISLASGTISLISAANFTPATGNMTFISAADRSAGTGAAVILREDGGNNTIRGQSAVANHWTMVGTSGTINASADDATWHAGIGVIQGASSSLSIDGTSTTGTVTGSTTAGSIATVGSASTTLEATEMGFYDNVTFTGTQITNVCRNIQAAYVAGNFGATC